MYQSFEAIIDHGHIKPVENMKLPDSARVLITIVDHNIPEYAQRLFQLLNEAEEDIRQKKTRPMKEFLKEFRNAKKISGRNHPKG